MAIYMQERVNLQALMGSSESDNPDLDIQGWIRNAEQSCPALAVLSECRQVQEPREAEQRKAEQETVTQTKLTLTLEHWA